MEGTAKIDSIDFDMTCKTSKNVVFFNRLLTKKKKTLLTDLKLLLEDKDYDVMVKFMKEDLHFEKGYQVKL